MSARSCLGWASGFASTERLRRFVGGFFVWTSGIHVGIVARLRSVSADDRDAAVTVVEHVLAHRTEEQPGEGPTPARAHDDQ